MKFLPYIFKNIMRNKTRTLFTGLSIAVCLFLVTVLYAYVTVQDQLGVESVAFNRLVVTHNQGVAFPIPIAYLDKVRAVPGVKTATQFSWFGGKYKDDRLPFAQFGVDPQVVTKVLEEYELPAEQLAKWQSDRAGCVVGWKIAQKKGWKLGDIVPLKGDLYPVDLELTVDGIYHGSDTVDGEQLWFNWNYLDELLKRSREAMSGNAGTVFIKCTSGNVLPSVAEEIDKRFASSTAPTRTMTEQAFQQMFTDMLGNVRAYIRNTTMAVVFSLVCVAGNAMAMSMRERSREVAVLRAIGFGQNTVLWLVLAEAIAISLFGGLLGVMAAKLLFRSGGGDLLTIPGFSQFYVPWITVVFGLSLAAAVGLVSGAIPAWRAARISVVDGLRRVV